MMRTRGIVAEVRIEQFAGAVGRTVIHDDHFQLRIVASPAPS